MKRYLNLGIINLCVSLYATVNLMALATHSQIAELPLSSRQLQKSESELVSELEFMSLDSKWTATVRAYKMRTPLDNCHIRIYEGDSLVAEVIHPMLRSFGAIDIHMTKNRVVEFRMFKDHYKEEARAKWDQLVTRGVLEESTDDGVWANVVSPGKLKSLQMTDEDREILAYFFTDEKVTYTHDDASKEVWKEFFGGLAKELYKKPLEEALVFWNSLLPIWEKYDLLDNLRAKLEEEIYYIFTTKIYAVTDAEGLGSIDWQGSSGELVHVIHHKFSPVVADLPTVYQDPFLKVYEHKDIEAAKVLVDAKGVKHVFIPKGKLGEIARMELNLSKREFEKITQYITFQLEQRELEKGKARMDQGSSKKSRIFPFFSRKSTKIKPFNVEPLFGDYKYIGGDVSLDPHYTDLQKVYAELLPYYTWGVDEPQAFLNNHTREEYSWLRMAMAAMTEQSFAEYHIIKDGQRRNEGAGGIVFTADHVKRMVDIGQGLLVLWHKVEPEFKKQKQTQRAFANFMCKNLYFIVWEIPFLKDADLRDAIVFELYDRWTRLKSIDSIPSEDYWKKFANPLLVLSEQRDPLRVPMFDYFSDTRYTESLYQWTELLPQIYGDMKRVPESILGMLNMLRSYYFSGEMDREHPPKIIDFLSWLYIAVRDEVPGTARKLLQAVDSVSKSFPRVSSIKPGAPGYVEYAQRMQGRMIVMANNITLLRTLSNSSKYQLNRAYILLAQWIDLHIVLASDFDAMEKIDLEKSFWDILKAVEDPQDLIDVFKVVHQEMRDRKELTVHLDQIAANLRVMRNGSAEEDSLQVPLAKQNGQAFDHTDMLRNLLDLSDTTSTERRMKAFEEMMNSNTDVAQKVVQYLNEINQVVQVHT